MKNLYIEIFLLCRTYGATSPSLTAFRLSHISSLPVHWVRCNSLTTALDFFCMKWWGADVRLKCFDSLSDIWCLLSGGLLKTCVLMKYLLDSSELWVWELDHVLTDPMGILDRRSYFCPRLSFKSFWSCWCEHWWNDTDNIWAGAHWIIW